MTTLRAAHLTLESHSELNPLHSPARFKFSTPAFQLFVQVSSCVDSYFLPPNPANLGWDNCSASYLSIWGPGDTDTARKSQKAHLHLPRISRAKRGDSCNKQIFGVGSVQAKRERKIIHTQLNKDSTVGPVVEVQTFTAGVHFCFGLFAIILKP